MMIESLFGKRIIASSLKIPLIMKNLGYDYSWRMKLLS
jgi:hypothetical protein